MPLAVLRRLLASACWFTWIASFQVCGSAVERYTDPRTVSLWFSSLANSAELFWFLFDFSCLWLAKVAFVRSITSMEFILA